MLEAAHDTNTVETVLEELQALASVLQEKLNILNIFEHARITAAEQAHLLNTLTQDDSPLVEYLLKLTTQYGRFGALPDINSTFNRAVDDEAGIIADTVTTAVALTADTADALRS